MERFDSSGEGKVTRRVEIFVVRRENEGKVKRASGVYRIPEFISNLSRLDVAQLSLRGQSSICFVVSLYPQPLLAFAETPEK
jgi:hypothetical protein